jgi:hypothetical protein
VGAIDDVTPRLTAWTTGIIVEKDLPTPTTVRLRMHVEDRQRHRPGQHYLIRLRAPDDYTAQRSYSVASADHDPLLEFLVEKLPDGEVSEFLADVAEVGDVLELRGPIGRWFLWDTRTPALCLVAGTGVVPAVAMTRAARHLGRTDLLHVVAVGRGHESSPTPTSWAGTAPCSRSPVRTRTSDPRARRPPGGHAVAGRRRGRVRLRIIAVRRVRDAPPAGVRGRAAAIRVEQFGATGYSRTARQSAPSRRTMCWGSRSSSSEAGQKLVVEERQGSGIRYSGRSETQTGTPGRTAVGAEP